MLHQTSPRGYEMLAAKAMVENESVELDTEGVFDYEASITHAKPKVKTAIYPEKWLASFPKAYHSPYLYHRGATEKICRHFDVRFDGLRNRICFPVRTFKGYLAGMQGRDVTDQQQLRYKTYKWKDHKNGHLWLNENHVTLDQPLVLVEGPIDALKVAMVYRNVLASMTSQVTEEKFKRVRDALKLVTFFDSGDAGDKARKRVAALAKPALVLHIYPPDNKGDPGAMTPLEIKEALAFLL